MPGLITHYICSESVLNTVRCDLKKIITQNRNLYNIGAQGPDIFFYYLPGLIKKRTRGLGIKMHTSKFSRFFQAIVEEIGKTDDARDKNALISYACGYLTHYCLDYNAHPYIYYKAGFRRDGDLRSLKYSVYHRSFETAIDIAMLRLVNSEKPADKRLWQLLSVSRGDAVYVSDAIGKSISSAYGSPVTGREVYKSMAYMARLTRLMQSKKGRRKRLMEFVEEMTVGGRICSSLVHDQELTDGLDYLNIKKAVWKKPYDGTTEFTLSFTEIFDKACGDAKVMLDALYAYTQNEVTLERLLEAVGDYSLKTGAHGEENAVFSFHDIIFEN